MASGARAARAARASAGGAEGEQLCLPLSPSSFSGSAPLGAERLGDPERAAWRRCPLVVGIDEAGRGPWAGPVVAAAVVFPPWESPPADLEGLNDSKQLSHEARAALLAPIARHALAVGVARVSAAEIDALNILRATFVAMRGAARRALARLERRAGVPPALLSAPPLLLIDGNRLLPPALLLEGLDAREAARVARWSQEALVKGDARSWSIAAASVVAKEARDRLMTLEDRAHPGYGFAQHKGYGTPAHQRALDALGPCAAHRLSYKPVAARRPAR